MPLFQDRDKLVFASCVWCVLVVDGVFQLCIVCASCVRCVPIQRAQFEVSLLETRCMWKKRLQGRIQAKKEERERESDCWRVRGGVQRKTSKQDNNVDNTNLIAIKWLIIRVEQLHKTMYHIERGRQRDISEREREKEGDAERIEERGGQKKKKTESFKLETTRRSRIQKTKERVAKERFWKS